MIKDWEFYDLERKVEWLESEVWQLKEDVSRIDGCMATEADVDDVWERLNSLSDEIEELKKQLEDLDIRLERIESFIKELKGKYK